MTMEDMLYHTKLWLGCPTSVRLGDMPFMSYQAGHETASQSGTVSAGWLKQSLEGGAVGRSCGCVDLIGIPVRAISQTPQSFSDRRRQKQGKESIIRWLLNDSKL